MKKNYFSLSILLMMILAFGCQSSKETTQEQQSQTEVKETPPPPPAEEKSAKVDTLDVKIEDNTKVAYEPPPPPPATTQTQAPVMKTISGNFSVQLGAFQAEQNALQFAYSAKIKLNENIHNILDKGTNLYRIMVGSFDTKDAARAFRDQVVNNNPEYKGAWVVDVNKDVKR
jgi:cell division septation protein DedD